MTHTTDHLIASYEAEALRNRSADWATYVTEAKAEPGEIVDEVLEHASSHFEIDPDEIDARSQELGVAVRAWVEGLTEVMCPAHQRALDLQNFLGAEKWQAVADEMADHQDYDTAEAFWADFLWYCRFLAMGGGEAGMAAADGGRDTDRGLYGVHRVPSGGLSPMARATTVRPAGPGKYNVTYTSSVSVTGVIVPAEKMSEQLLAMAGQPAGIEAEMAPLRAYAAQEAANRG